MGIASTRNSRSRISDEIRAAIVTADPSVKHADLARKYGISDVSVFTIRKAAGVVQVKGPRSKPTPKAATSEVKKSSAVKIPAAVKQAPPQSAPQVSHEVADTFAVTLNLTLDELEAIFLAMSPDVKVIAISAALQHKAGVA